MAINVSCLGLSGSNGRAVPDSATLHLYLCVCVY